MQQSAQQALERLENEQRDMPRRLRNARAADARARFDAAHGQYDPWTVQGSEDDVAALEARATALPGLIFNARVTLAETGLDAVTAELTALESEEEARRDNLAATALELRRARDAHEAARAADSAARARMAHIRAGALPHAAATLDQLTNQR